MKIQQKRVLAFVLMLWFALPLYADRSWSQSEIDDLTETLITNASDFWLTSGTIEAYHVEYHGPQTTDEDWVQTRIEENIKEYLAKEEKAQLTEERQEAFVAAMPFNTRYLWLNEYSQVTQEDIVIHKGRYRYRIEVLQREDSMAPSGDLLDNEETDEFKVGANRKRDFYWDGLSSTHCFNSVANAIIEDREVAPDMVVTPLVAGFLSWSQGDLSTDSLENSAIKVLETSLDDRTVVELTLVQNEGDFVYSMVLDPALDYAPLSWQCTRSYGLELVDCNDYVQAGDRWVPTRIYTERQDQTGRLLNSHRWTFNVSDVPPVSSQFQAKIPVNTHVMRINPVSSGPLYYYYNPMTDSDLLLAERLAVIQESELVILNCASTQLHYAANSLGVSLDWDQAASLVNSEGLSSMKDMAELAENLGLNAQAVNLTWEQMEDLSGVQAILYRPELGHFVLLDQVTSSQAWIIDLSSNTFYRPLGKEVFASQETFAVLLLSQEVALSSEFSGLLTSEEQSSLLGGSDQSGCSVEEQGWGYEYCISIEGLCYGNYVQYYPYTQCEDIPDCTEELYIKKSQSSCFGSSPWCSIGEPQITTVWACDGEYKSGE